MEIITKAFRIRCVQRIHGKYAPGENISSGEIFFFPFFPNCGFYKPFIFTIVAFNDIWGH